MPDFPDCYLAEQTRTCPATLRSASPALSCADYMVKNGSVQTCRPAKPLVEHVQEINHMLTKEEKKRRKIHEVNLYAEVCNAHS